MKHNHILIITSLLSILLITLHLTSDTIHAGAGTPEAGGSTLIGVPVLAIWLYGTLLLNERRLGLVIMLVGSLLTMGMMFSFILSVRGLWGLRRGQPR